MGTQVIINEYLDSAGGSVSIGIDFDDENLVYEIQDMPIAYMNEQDLNSLIKVLQRVKKIRKTGVCN